MIFDSLVSIENFDRRQKLAQRRLPLIAQYLFKALQLTLLASLIIILIRNFWISEDAFITLRVVDNVINGYGLRWNINERVQVFTHPLWVIILSVSNYFSSNIYIAVFIPSVGSSLLYLYVFFRQQRRLLNFLLIFTLLLSSKCFVDYSSSGLENVLGHALTFFCYLELSLYKVDKTRPWAAVAYASLLLLVRLDFFLLICPPLIQHIFTLKQTQRVGWKFFVCLTPLILWELFSLVYYGSFFPNTYFAKLNHNLPIIDRLKLGADYFAHSITIDPITLVTISLSLLILLFTFRGGKKLNYNHSFGLGMGMYLIYILIIGGDYMTGRFFSVTFVIGVLIIADFLEEQKYPPLFLFFALISASMIGLSSARPPILTTSHYKPYPKSEISVFDEMGFRYELTGFLTRDKGMRISVSKSWIQDALRAKSEKKVQIVYPSIGLFGYYAGPNIDVVDPYALADFFLARTKEIDPTVIKIYGGHYRRKIPRGYTDWRLNPESSSTHLNPEYRKYLAIVKTLTRDPVFKITRLLTIVKFNLGFYDHFLMKTRDVNYQ